MTITKHLAATLLIMHLNREVWKRWRSAVGILEVRALGQGVLFRHSHRIPLLTHPTLPVVGFVLCVCRDPPKSYDHRRSMHVPLPPSVHNPRALHCRVLVHLRTDGMPQTLNPLQGMKIPAHRPCLFSAKVTPQTRSGVHVMYGTSLLASLRAPFPGSLYLRMMS